MKPVFLLGLCSLVGCAEYPVSFGVRSAASAVGAPGYATAALGKAENDFLGGPSLGPAPPSLVGTPPPGDLLTFPGNSGTSTSENNIVLGSGPPTIYRNERGSLIEISASHDDKLGGTFSLTTRFVGSRSYEHVQLPNGFGVLTDPMRVDASSTGVGAQLLLTSRQKLNSRFQSAYSAGLGISRAQTDVHVLSSLIDLHSKSYQSLPYAMLDMAIEENAGLTLDGQIKVFQSKDAELTIGIGKNF